MCTRWPSTPGTLLSLLELRPDVLQVLGQPLQPLLTLRQLHAVQRAPLHLQCRLTNTVRQHRNIEVTRNWKLQTELIVQSKGWGDKNHRWWWWWRECKWPHTFSCSAAVMWLTSLWSWACRTCFWLSNSSTSSLWAFCSLCSSICRASCSLDGLAKSETDSYQRNMIQPPTWCRPCQDVIDWI